MTIKHEEDVYVPGNAVQAVPVENETVPMQSAVPVQQQYQQPPQYQQPSKTQQHAATVQQHGGAPSTAVMAAGPVDLSGLGKDPKRITCPFCHETAVTRTKDEIDACTVIAIVVLLLTVWFLFWIPLVGNCCKSTSHYCGHCHRKVGTTSAC